MTMKISTIYAIIYVQKSPQPFYIKAYSIIHTLHGQSSSLKPFIYNRKYIIASLLLIIRNNGEHAMHVSCVHRQRDQRGDDLEARDTCHDYIYSVVRHGCFGKLKSKFSMVNGSKVATILSFFSQ